MKLSVAIYPDNWLLTREQWNLLFYNLFAVISTLDSVSIFYTQSEVNINSMSACVLSNNIWNNDTVHDTWYNMPVTPLNISRIFRYLLSLIKQVSIRNSEVLVTMVLFIIRSWWIYMTLFESVRLLLKRSIFV